MGSVNMFWDNIGLGDMSLLQMSFSAAVMILAIIVVRILAINKLPKKVFVLLWDVVLLRLLIPVSIPSVFSAYTFIKRSEPVQEAIKQAPAAGIITQVTGTPVNTGISSEAIVPNATQSFSLLLIIWSIGFFLCVAFFVASYVRCLLEFQTSLPVKNEFTVRWLRCHRLKRKIQIRQSDRINAPLTYGILKPVILMPKKTDWENEQQLQYVLLHEYTHICRFDTVTKLIAVLALCIHWFNPFVWVMYILFNRDIELSCDERVVRRFGENTKSFYAKTLITMEEKKSGLTPLYNSFSRNAIEERITAIMKTKRITMGIVATSILVIVAIVVLFATSAKNPEEEMWGTDENVVEQESVQGENGEMEIGMVSEAVTVTGTPLEMAKKEVSRLFTQMKENGYVNWRIDSLTEEYQYGPNEEQSLDQIRVGVYRLDYCFLAEDPDTITLADSMTIDEDGWVTLEYPGSTYLCVIADGGALSYMMLKEKDCVPGDEVFTADLKQLLGVSPETEDDYYAMAPESELPKETVAEENMMEDSTQIFSIVIINGNTGDRKTLTSKESHFYDELITLYKQLDFSVQSEENTRIGYQYSMVLQDADGNKVQSITPYKDGVAVDGTFYQYDNTGNNSENNAEASLKLMEYIESIFGNIP